jgi:hypothetical protein
LTDEKETYRKVFKRYMDGDAPSTIRHFEEKRKQQQERADRGEPNEVGLITYNEASLVAAYATFYAAEDLLRSSEKLNVLTYVLIVLTAILGVLTFSLATR